MATQILPFQNGILAQRFRVTLEGTTFRLIFHFNQRYSTWFYDILTEEGVEILMGRPVFLDIDVIGRFADERLPLGSILPIDTTTEQREPDIDELGERVLLVYQESEDLLT